MLSSFPAPRPISHACIMNSIYWTRHAAQYARSIRPDRIIALECAAQPLMHLPECCTESVIQTGPDTFELCSAGLTLALAWSRATAQIVVYECGATRERTRDEVVRDVLIPHDVVIRAIRGASCPRAWREYLRVTQFDLAQRLGVSQPSLSATERTPHLRRRTIERLAQALNISEQQLMF
jgi:DNA-binding XRE family transcriptional regulator